MYDGMTLSAKECAALARVGRVRWSRWVRQQIAPQSLNPEDREGVWSRDEIEKWLRRAGPDMAHVAEKND